MKHEEYQVGQEVIAAPREIGTVSRRGVIRSLYVQPEKSRIKRHRVEFHEVVGWKPANRTYAVRVEDIRPV